MASIPQLWLLAFVLVSFAFVEVYSKWTELQIPEHFSDRNVGDYTVRYASPWGTDSEDCLVSQPHNISEGCDPVTPNRQPITYCKTVGYSLVGGCVGHNAIDCVPDVQRNLIVVVANGSVFATYGRLQVDNFVNLLLMKAPGCDEELAISCMNFTEDVYNGIYIQYSRNIAVNRLTFAHCGPKSNGIAFRDVYEAVVSNSIFRNNLNSGIANYDSHNASFINCTFKDNYSRQQYSESDILNPGQYRYAGGLTLIWQNQSFTQTNILVRNCTFVNNTAGVNRKNENDIRPNLYIPRGQGGAILTAFNGTQNHDILIEDSLVKDNVATFNGGGIFISFYNGSNSNSIEINNTLFLNNSCKETGGAIGMYTFEVANENRLKINNVVFRGNKALAGGGACTINLQDNQISAASNSRFLVENIGVFNNCSFIENSSPAGGSAVGLVTNTRVDQVIRPTNFTNCEFIDNVARVDSGGAIMAFRYPISFLGTLLFRGNQGGGMTLLQSYLNNHGSAWFEKNYAMNGGGMEMRDSSFIQLFNNSNMTFVSNKAVNRGGGLSTSSASSLGIDSDIIRLFNTRCFLQYDFRLKASYPPELWKVSLNFTNNVAGEDGGAIYATALQSCLYTNTLKESPIIFEYSILKLPQFSFTGNSVLKNSSLNNLDIGTAPSWLRVVPDNITAAPGEILTFNISALDEGGNWKEAVWSYNDYTDVDISDSFLSLKAGGESHNYPVGKLSSAENCTLNISRVITFTIIQILSGSAINHTNVTIGVVCCYPGYELVDGYCTLKRTAPILRADTSNHYVYIQPQFYAEYDYARDIFIYAILPIPFHLCNTEEVTLPGCLVKYDDPYQQCRDNRTGFLCGKCPEGQGVDLTLRQCRNCSIRDTILVIIIIVLFGVTCALIMIFNVRIPNELRGCLFFIQVVGFVYSYTSGARPSWDFHISRLFGTSLYLTLCPLPGAKALYTASYGLILPALGIIIILVFVISARFLRHLSNKNSLDGIWFLSIIIYKFIADTSFIILRCQKVIGSSKFVFYYDGSNECFTASDLEHLGFAILALVLGVLVILFPVLILLVSFRKFNLSLQFTDVLNKDLKNSCRWWGSFDLFRRLLFFIIVLLFNYVAPSFTQLALFYAGLGVFFVFACSKPYKSQTANIMEAVVMLDLIIITGLFLNISRNNLDSVRSYASALMLFPFLAIAFYYTINICSYCWGRWCPHSVKTRCLTWKSKLKNTLAMFMPFLEERKYSRGELLTSELATISLAASVGDGDSTTDADGGDMHTGYSSYREELIG